MSGEGQPESDDLDGRGMRVAVVASRWHAEAMAGLLAGAERALAAFGAWTSCFPC